MAEAGICPGDCELWRLQGLLSFPLASSGSSVVWSDCKPLRNHCILTEHLSEISPMEMIHSEALGPSCPQGTHSEHEYCTQSASLGCQEKCSQFPLERKNNVLVILVV